LNGTDILPPRTRTQECTLSTNNEGRTCESAGQALSLCTHV